MRISILFNLSIKDSRLVINSCPSGGEYTLLFGSLSAVESSLDDLDAFVQDINAQISTLDKVRCSINPVNAGAISVTDANLSRSI